MSSLRSDIFWARVCALKLEDLSGNFKSKGIDTFAKYAYGSSFTPTVSDPDLLDKKLLEPIAGDAIQHIPMLRYLWWEA